MSANPPKAFIKQRTNQHNFMYMQCLNQATKIRMNDSFAFRYHIKNMFCFVLQTAIHDPKKLLNMISGCIYKNSHKNVVHDFLRTLYPVTKKKLQSLIAYKHQDSNSLQVNHKMETFLINEKLYRNKPPFLQQITSRSNLQYEYTQISNIKLF